MERINVRVQGALKQKLEREAARDGVSPSQIVRRVLEEMKATTGIDIPGTLSGRTIDAESSVALANPVEVK